jgi:integrase
MTKAAQVCEPMLSASLAPQQQTEAPKPSTLTQPRITFADVLAAVDQAPTLSAGVQQNMRAAVRRCAELMSAAGVHAAVDIPAIAKRLEKLSPRRLGFTNPNSFSAWQSNLRRALRLAGLPITPAHCTSPLSAPWLELQASIHDDPDTRRKLSRFMHVASEKGWMPCEISDDHIDRYHALLRATCIKSKRDKTVRNTIRAWNRAVTTVPGWPQQILHATANEWYYSLPWSKLPVRYREDVETFLARGETADWLDVALDAGDEKEVRPLHPRTKSNYRGALCRAASILIRLGAAPESIRSLADVVSPDAVKRILIFLRDRTGREQGGHVGYMALVLFLAARDHVQASEEHLKKLEQFVANTADHHRGMSERTCQRLVQFDDAAALDRLEDLPEELVRSVKRLPINTQTATVVRTALCLSLLFDTELRSGNVVALDLDRHIFQGAAGSSSIHLMIGGDEIKNGVEFRGALKPGTAHIWKLYVEVYRKVHLGQPCTWLFPRIDGSHWTQQNAYSDQMDVCDKWLGLDVNPHLVRALVGKIILDTYPGGHAIAQQVLGHKQLITTVTYYAVTKPAEARALYHEILEQRRNGTAPELS